MDRRKLGYMLIAIGLSLLALAWTKSFPVGVESRNAYLYDSIYPLFWPGLSIANVGLFLVASGSKSRPERFLCAFAFFLLAYSIKYYFIMFEGSDTATFTALTEHFGKNRILLAEEHDYYQWPLLFILGTIVSDVTGMGTQAVVRVLFFVWTFVFSAGLFLYTDHGNDVRDFLSLVVYGVSGYAFLNWQFAPWTFGLALLTLCVVLMCRVGISWSILTVTVYAALLFAHGFIAVFVLLAASMMAIRKRRYLGLAISFALLYVSYLMFSATMLFVGLTAVLMQASLFYEYLSVAEQTLLGPVSLVDAFAQAISRLVTLSMWGLLAFSTISALVLKKLRAIDVGLGLSGIVSGVAGAVVPVLGTRANEIVFLPATYALRTLTLVGRRRKVVLAFFLVVLMIFPLGLIHFFYDDTNYMTVREKHAADIVFIALHDGGGSTDFRMMIRRVVFGYLSSSSSTDTWYITEDSPPEFLAGGSWFRFMFVSPELEKTLLRYAGLSEAQLLQLESSTRYFSRVYSNGHVTVLENMNVTEVPTAGPS